MHLQQKIWCESIKIVFPNYFKKKCVLEIGSLDVNGNNKYLFDNCEYIGLDVISGENVDVVSLAHKYKTNKKFDVVFSTNALEHDKYYYLTIQKMISLTKSGGLIFFSAASKWKEHGTQNTTLNQSGTASIKMLQDYYKNLTIDDIHNSMDMRCFQMYYITLFKKDLRFFGIIK